MQMREATILDAGRAFLPTPHAFRLIASPQATLLGEEFVASYDRRARCECAWSDKRVMCDRRDAL